ncbi:TPA: hypothetical protein EYP66_23080 [Candidatus Poribacteria bacterium]|nr:hypothetical protein [Candidatus Poribacteria bacterium]
METVDHIRKNIEQIEKLLSEVKADLETLDKKRVSELKKSAEKIEKLPSEEKLRLEYENLYQMSIGGNANAIEEFIKSKTKTYLKAFCKANNLPIDTTKVSKDGIIKEVTQWMAQRKAITKKAT